MTDFFIRPSDPDDTADVGGVLFVDVNNVGSGTGNYDTFLKIGGNDEQISGYNTDDSGSLHPDNPNIGASQTETLLLANITSVFIGDEEYYQIRFDLNEPNTDPISEQISIEEFRIWIGDTSTVITRTELEALNKIYDLDEVDTTGDDVGDDNTILMSEVSTGSGTDDYAIFIPVSLFGDADPTDTYVYFDVTMGQNAPSDYEQAGGFEEFNIIEAGYIFGTKFEDLNGNGIQDGGELRLEGIRIYIDENNDGEWNEGEKFDITDDEGKWFLTGVEADGTNLIIREELPDVAPGEYEWEATNPDGVDGNGAYWNASVNSTGDNTEIHIGNFQPRPSFTVVKDVDRVDTAGDGVLNAVGDIVTYTITVHNDGNVPLTNVTVTDPLLGGAVTDFTGDDGDGVLSAGETWVYTGSYALKQEDLDSNATVEPADSVAGLLENTACVVASYDGVALEEQCDDAEVPITLIGGIELTKTADVEFIEAPGSITYTYVLTASDEANHEQTIVSLIDDNYTPGDPSDDLDILALGSFSGDTDGDGKLDVDEDWVYEITVDIDEATYLANDTLINEACALTSDDETACDDETVEVHRYDIDIDKVAVDVIGSDTLEVTAAGQEIVYEISVENTGNRTLTGLSVTDSLDPSLEFTGGDTNDNGAFDAGETWTYEATYVVTQADINGNGIDINGVIDGDEDVDNRATADADKVDPVTADEEVPIVQVGGIVLEKLSSTTVISGPQFVTYTFTLTAADDANYAQDITSIVDYGFVGPLSGNPDLAGLTGHVLYDGSGEVAGDNNMDGKLDLGETWTLNYIVEITQEMFDSNLGELANVACATTADGEEDCDDHDIDRRIIDIEKTVVSVDGDTDDKVVEAAGEEIVYRIAVTNPGDVGLRNVVVTDTIADAVYESGDTNDDDILDTDEEWIYRATYTVTQDDLDDNFAGDQDIDNVATAVARNVGPVQDDAEVPIRYANGVELEKTSDVEVITRPEEGVPTMVTYTITLRPADVANYEQFINMVVDQGFGPGTVGDIDEIFYNASYVEGVSDPDLAPVYAFGEAPGDTDGDGYLDVDEVWTFELDAEITREMFDENFGQLNNVACVDVNDLDEICIEYNIDRRDIGIQKTVFSINGDEDDELVNWAGDVVEYRIAVTNEGDLGLTNVAVEDSIADAGSVVYLSGDDGDGVLDTDETWIYGATYTVKQSDINGDGIDINGLTDGDGDIDNRATAIADLVGEVEAFAEVDLLYDPDLTFTKRVVDVGGDGADGVADEAGDVITYELVATNTGNVTLTNVTINDPLTGTDSTILIPGLTLSPGGSVVLGAEQYTVTQDDLDSQGVTADGGEADCDIDNTAIAVSDQTDAEEASAVVPLAYNPMVDLEKLVSVNGGEFVDADLPTGPQVTVNGSTATFRIEVTNTGNISLTNLALTDVLDPDGAGSAIDLSPYVITGLTDTDGDGAADDLAVGDTAWLEYSMAVTADQHTNRATVTFSDEFGDALVDKNDQVVTDSDDANYFGLIGDGPGVRTPGGWGNSFKLKSYWDGEEGFVAGDETFPDAEINVNMIVNGEERQGIIIGGDYDNILEDGEIFVDLATACDLLENSTGGAKRDKLDDLARHAIAATLNGLAGNNIFEDVPDDDLDSPEDWLNEAAAWLLASSSEDGELLVSGYDRGATLIRANSDAWKDGYDEGDIASGSDILGALGEYNETGVIDGVRYAHDADSAVLATALSIAADEFLFG